MKTIQIKAIVLLMLFLFESFWPSVALALTYNPIQPEYASYEDINNTDMVNPITGDFTYTMPIVNVPSPEGGFQIPLSYHAGIEMDEESSWVGLGWSLNPGVLNRQVSMYPDDYDGSQKVNNDMNLGSTNGNGYIESKFLVTRMYDSHSGKSWSVNFSDIIGFGKSEAKGVGVSVLGVDFSKDGVKYDVMKSGGGIINLAGVILSAEAGPIGTLFNLGVGISDAIASSMTQNSVKVGEVNDMGGGFKVEPTEVKNKFGYSKLAYNYWIQKSADCKPMGTLYLGNMPRYTDITPMPPTSSQYHQGQLVFNGGTWGTDAPANQSKYLKNMQDDDNASDFFTYFDKDVPLTNQFQPSSLAYDNFFINAGGASGAISPTRLDPGSLASNILSGNNQVYFDFCLTPYKPNKTNTIAGYKVPFRYLGDISNSYDYNLTRNSAGSITTKFAVDWNYGGNTNYFQVSVNDNKILNEDVAGGTGRTAIEGQRPITALNNELALTNNQELVHGKHISWYSNYEIINSQAVGFMNSGINRSSFPINGIGGFSVTREDGLTYHFSIPVYNKSQYTRIQNGSDKYEVTDNNPYATCWLLTGITGADFVDRGTPGVIDNDDWGYWVKLDYGMYNNNYCWRKPYFGWDYGKDGVKTYSRGVKQTYYLNTIKTRSHTALFIKEEKSDGKSYFETDQNALDVNETGSDPIPSAVSKSLRLKEIRIIDNETFNQIASSTTNTKLNNLSYNGTLSSSLNWNNISGNSNVDNINANVLLVNDINTTDMYTVRSVQSSGIVFNYNYVLCDGTLNSWSTSGSPAFDSFNYSGVTGTRTGKLTLTSIDLLGIGDEKYSNSYSFYYGQNDAGPNRNPNYSIFYRDDFGFYQSSFGSTFPTVGNEPKNPGPEGDQWSLKGITTPLGAGIQIEYERDTYSGVNGKSNGWYPMKIIPTSWGGSPLINSTNNSSVFRVYTDPSMGNMNNFLIVGNYGYFLRPAYTYYYTNTQVNQEKFDFTINSVGSNYFEFTSSDPNLSTKISDINTYPNWGNSYAAVVTGLSGNNPRYGGNLRVKNIITNDDLSNKYVTRYDYNNSGVATYEDPTTAIGVVPNYQLLEHPNLPILYSKVTMYKGRMNGSNLDWINKTEMKFKTPTETDISVDKGGSTPQYPSSVINPGFSMGPFYAIFPTNSQACNPPSCIPAFHHDYRARAGHVVVKDFTARIGQLEEVTNYNSRNEVLSQTKFEYTDNLSNYTEFDNMGQYAENNFLWEGFEDLLLSNSNTLAWSFRLLQTSKVKYPSALKSITSNIGGITTTKTFATLDYLTGRPLEIHDQIGGSTGEEYITTYSPAYLQYPEMGPKAWSPCNKNIMSANVQEKKFVDSYFNLLSSNVTTWSKGINYRLYDQSTAAYSSVQFPYASSTQIAPYHPHKQFVWKSIPDKNGTVAASGFVDYNWTSSTQDSRWIKTSEATLYDKYSRLLEGIDVNGKHISSKYTLGFATDITSVYNCGYGEWCFSGAEDVGGGNESNYFGGEVFETASRVFSPAFAHTGNYALKVASGQFDQGFHFKGSFGSNGDFKPAKRYRASVWVHSINYTNAVLYCELRSSANAILNNQSITIPPGSVKEKYGNWYKLDLDITMWTTNPGSGAYVLFGCYSANSNAASYVYFDDFRVHPADVPLVTDVSDKLTNNVVATLDAENIATRYSYDNTNRLIKSEKETRSGFVKISEHEYHFR
jgi:hypothetical protein